jgi:hypothetical protein
MSARANQSKLTDRMGEKRGNRFNYAKRDSIATTDDRKRPLSRYFEPDCCRHDTSSRFPDVR